MTVYAIVQLKIHDRPTYDRYMGRFMPVFEKFNGKVLVADDAPKVLEGEWDANRVVVLSFPDKASFFAWAGSPEYQEIAKDRIAATQSTVLLAEGVA
ncbi:MAG: DUF1330 domain-containing protein [Parvularculaceae bacterium]|nr:DUF1330 domain-containing protein [Parvularculaceae bacterium]